MFGTTIFKLPSFVVVFVETGLRPVSTCPLQTFSLMISPNKHKWFLVQIVIKYAPLRE
jgi:hypothetical protein